MMNENHRIQLAEVPIGGKGGFVWNRLHGEREDICETLLKDSETGPQTRQQQECLQSRLRRIDDALDRLMSGAYGVCSQCGRPIQEATLEVDAASSLCRDCWDPKSSGFHAGSEMAMSETDSGADVRLADLNSFDTILLHTLNSEYRILMLDPKTGRALVEGGNHLLEPREALIRGSALPGAAFERGALGIGGRLEMWVDERAFITSTIKSIEVKHNAPPESLSSISGPLHSTSVH